MAHIQIALDIIANNILKDPSAKLIASYVALVFIATSVLRSLQLAYKVFFGISQRATTRTGVQKKEQVGEGCCLWIPFVNPSVRET
jgi:hypothetical protein